MWSKDPRFLLYFDRHIKMILGSGRSNVAEKQTRPNIITTRIRVRALRARAANLMTPQEAPKLTKP